MLRPAQLPVRDPAPKGAKLLPDMLAVRPLVTGAAPKADAGAADGLVKASAPPPDRDVIDLRGGKLLRFARGALDKDPDAAPASTGCCLSAWCSPRLSMLVPICAEPWGCSVPAVGPEGLPIGDKKLLLRGGGDSAPGLKLLLSSAANLA